MCELAPRAAPELWGAPHQQGEMSPALLRGCTVWVCFIYKKRKNISDLSLLIFHVFGWSVTPGKASAALLASSGIVAKSILSHWVDLPTQSLLPDGLLQVWLLPCLFLGEVWSIYCPTHCLEEEGGLLSCT